MKILSIINEDIIQAVDDNNERVIVFGNGVGEGKNIGDRVNINRISRILKTKNEIEERRVLELFSQASLENLNLVDQGIRLLETNMGEVLDVKLYLSLMDHIVFALERIEQNINFKNQLLREIRKYYPEEFVQGKKVITFLSEKKNIPIPEDEAGYIALHIANAKSDLKIPIAETTTKIINNSLRTIEFRHNVELDERSLAYQRFISHFKNGVERAFSGHMVNDEDEIFFELIKEQYSEIYKTATRIARYIYNRYDILLTENELINLTIHINKLLESSN